MTTIKIIDEEVLPEIRVLEKATELISTTRHNDYGDAVDDFRVVAEFWTTYLKAQGCDYALDAKDVALMMALLKLRREATHPKKDNVDDAVGYIALAFKCDQAPIARGGRS
jgi:hypothetical protein